MKKNVIKNINEIRSIVSKMPRTINEAVFDEVGGYMNEADDIVDAEPKMVEPQMGMGGDDQMPAQQAQPEAPVEEPAPEAPQGVEPDAHLHQQRKCQLICQRKRVIPMRSTSNSSLTTFVRSHSVVWHSLLKILTTKGTSS